MGGLLAVYPPGIDPEKLSEEILRCFPKMKINKEFTRENVGRIAKKILEILASGGVLVVPISLTGNLNKTVYSAPDQGDELHDERVGDNLHRELVRCVVEL